MLLIPGLIPVSGQIRFDSSQAERILTSLPKRSGFLPLDDNIIKVIEAVDRKYRQITDTIYKYQSLNHTILRSSLIETNDSLFINPLLLGDNINLNSIIFYSNRLNNMVDSIAGTLSAQEKNKFFSYLNRQYDHFSIKDKHLHAQPVGIRYIKFNKESSASVGIDIYGAHFLWTVEKGLNWEVTKVEQLWVY